MTRLRVLASRIRALFSLRRIDREFEQELESHEQLLTEENLRRGMSPGEARRVARLRLGNPSSLRESNHDRRGLPFVESSLRDVAYAVRMLRKSPGFALIAILTLAIGIGANTAIFGIVDSGLLRPLPVRNPGRVVVIAYQRHGGKLLSYFSYPNFRDIRNESSSAFSGMAAYESSFDGLGKGSRSQRVLTNYVTGNFFTLLGIRPSVGRLIQPSEGRATVASPVVVLSYTRWQTQFGGDRAIIGRKVLIDDQPVTVIGVTPKGFHGVMPFVETDAYLPLSMALVGKWDSRSSLAKRTSAGPFLILGRLRSGVSLAQSQAVLGVIARRLSSDHPRSDSGLSLSAYPQTLARPAPMLHNPIPAVAALFLALAAMVLLLACINIVNLLLVRAAARSHEMAVRSALGGTRARLIRQLLTESLLLAVLGGAGGILLGIWTCAEIGSVNFSPGLPLLLDFHFDWRVFLYAFAVAMVAGVLVGIVPALRASRVEPAAVLHEGGRGLTPGRQRLRSALVVAQVAGSLMLLVIAGLFTRSLQRVQQVHLGFDPSHVLNLSMDPHEIGYTDAQSREFYQELLRRARNLPGVRSAGIAFTTPFRLYTASQDSVDIDGYTPPPGKPEPYVYFNSVSPGFFRTMRIPLDRGRTFTDADGPKSAPVAIINEAMARRFWPHEDPIGRKFHLAGGPAQWEIVGVVGNSRMMKLTGPPQPYFFLPVAQLFTSYETLQLRTAGPAAAMIPQARGLIHSMAPDLPLFDVGTMNEMLSGSAFLVFRFGAVLAAALGLLGLLLALIGVYGVTSYAANRRTHEIGIRLALGAQPAQILRMIFSQGALIVALGLAIGLLGALAAARLVGSMLIISAADPLVYAAVSTVLALVALAACYVPARRAMRVDPTVGLRHE
jgi:predicted permease